MKPLIISTEDLLELILGSEIEGMELVQKVFKHKGRWSTQYNVIVKIGDRYGLTMYEEPATEQQDVERFPCPGDKQALMEMEPFQETVTRYRRIL